MADIQSMNDTTLPDSVLAPPRWDCPLNEATQQPLVLTPTLTHCPACGGWMRADYKAQRKLWTLQGGYELTCTVRRCRNADCPRYRQPYRPEGEGRLALPGHKLAFDVLLLLGRLRYVEHRSRPEMHQHLRELGLPVCERTVGNALDRYDELVALHALSPAALEPLKQQGRIVLAIDGLQPEKGHEVLWVMRDCVSGRILRCVSLLSSTQADLAQQITELKDELPVPIVSVVSDGQVSLRNAIAQALPDVPHQLCQFHFLREAGRPIYEADRHAKVQLKKKVRGIRPIERAVESSPDDQLSGIVLDFCQAVRSALTDDGRAPLDADGLKLRQRLQLIVRSLERLEPQLRQKGGSTPT